VWISLHLDVLDLEEGTFSQPTKSIILEDYQPIINASIRPLSVRPSSSVGPSWILAFNSDHVLHAWLITGTQCMDEFQVIPHWSYCLPARDYEPPIMVPEAPLLDSAGGLIWFNVPNDSGYYEHNQDPDFSSTFSPTTTLLRTTVQGLGASWNQDIVDMLDNDMPALYCACVKDYHSIGGLVAVGNAFGELAICDLSGSPRDMLESCSKPLQFPLLSDESMLSQSHIRSHSALPFPILGPKTNNLPVLDQEDPRTEEIAQLDPDDICPHDPLFLQSMQGRFLDDAWELAHVHHYYGQVKPLFYSLLHQADYFDIGGIIFTCAVAEHVTNVANPLLSLPGFLYPGNLIPRPYFCLVPIKMKNRFLRVRANVKKQWMYEVENGIDRGQKLLQRDGLEPCLY